MYGNNVKYIFLTPWKTPKSSLLFNVIEEYYSRVSKFIACEIITPHGMLNENEIVNFYTKEIKKTGVERPICFAFDENGNTYTSENFAKELKQQEIQGEKCVVFCFGSAYGLPKELRQLVRVKLISLSKLTFAHELAFAVALEQIYRARCIMENHPYHHGEMSPLAKEFINRSINSGKGN